MRPLKNLKKKRIKQTPFAHAVWSSTVIDDHAAVFIHLLGPKSFEAVKPRLNKFQFLNNLLMAGSQIAYQ